MASIYDRIYKVSPTWMQNLGISAYGLIWKQRRWGGDFLKLAGDFIMRESYSFKDWEEYQNAQLTKIIEAGLNTPFYQSSFQNAGLQLREVSAYTLDDLQKLPLLEKQSLRLQPDAFISKNANKHRLHSYSTSGTTGTPIDIMMSTFTHQAVSAAYEARCRRWAGVNYKMSRAMIGGRLVVPRADSKPPFWRYNLAERQLYMSAFHISPKNVPQYVHALNHYKPEYLVGYASSHYFLARMILDQGLEVHQPKAVLTSSEKLTPEMRQIIQLAYRSNVFDGYSGVEACCLASECEHHRLHLSPDVGIVELLDEDGQQVGPGQQGEIVATGLLNVDQPLIRYRTGDLAVWSETPCPCGRNLPVIEELVGRLEDKIIGPDGRETVRFHGIFIGLPHIVEGQIIQETLQDFRIKLVVTKEFSELDRETIRSRFLERIGRINLVFELVDHIERTDRGKYRALISNMIIRN